MRMSCNGCRVLRKGCSDDCTIRPCLQWIKSPDSQANATLFLAKFYGRAGLINLIDAGPPHLRPALFRSLLYEACGRIVNPVYGSVGLLWAGNWVQCQAAVDAVLKGSPVMQIPPPPPPPTTLFFDTPPPHPISPLTTCDIRHVSRDPDFNRFKTRTRFKRPVAHHQPDSTTGGRNIVAGGNEYSFSWLSHGCSKQQEDQESLFSSSVEEISVEGSLVNRAVEPEEQRWKSDEVGLDLTLGLLPM